MPADGIESGSVEGSVNGEQSDGNNAAGEASISGEADAVDGADADGDAVERPDEIEPRVGVLSEMRPLDTIDCANNNSLFQGTGEELFPFIIDNAADLAKIACAVNAGNGNYQTGKYWKLTNDINLSSLYAADLSWTDPSGTSQDGGWVPIGTNDSNKFSGTFDGNGHTISGLKINRPNTDYQGLFGYTTSTTTINNLGIVNSSVVGGNYTGAVIGFGDPTIAFNNTYNKGSVTGAIHTGGIVGFAGYMTMSNCYNSGDITSDATASDVDSDVGGLVGSIYDANITNSYNTGSVIGTALSVGNADISLGIGGLVGISRAGIYGGHVKISNSYNTGYILGSPKSPSSSTEVYYNTGGLVGLGGHVAVTNSYNTGYIVGVHFTGGLSGQLYYDSTIDNSYNTGSITGGSGSSQYDSRTGGICGISNSGLVTKNSLSLGKFIKAGAGEVGRITGNPLTTSYYNNNYAWGDMKVSSDGSDPTNPIGNEGSDLQLTNKKNGLGKTDTEILALFADDTNWALSGGNSGWESTAADSWYKQDNWLPVLRGFGAPTATTRTPSAFSGANTDTIGAQDGNWSTTLAGTKTISYSPGIGSNSAGTTVTDLTNIDGALSMVKAFGTGGAGFTAPSGGTFLYWCKTSPTGTPLNICPSGDRVLATATNVTFTADTTLTAVFKLPATINFSGLSFSTRAYDGTTTITPDSETLALGNSYALSDAANISCTYALDSKNAGTRKVMATCTLTGDDADRFAITSTAVDTGKTITVSKKDVTVSGITANDKTYNATTSATLDTSSASLSGVISGDSVSVTGCQGQFADANAGSSKPVTVTNCALIGADAANYQLSAQPSVGTANIDPFVLNTQGKVGDYYAIVGDILDDSNLLQSNYELKNTTAAPETITITWPAVTLSFSGDSSCVTTVENVEIPDCVLKTTTGDATIANSSGADVTANYTLSYSWTNGKLIVRPATVTETPADPGTGVVVEDPDGGDTIPGDACPAVEKLENDSPEFTALDAEITTANVLHKAWDIKLVNCNTSAPVTVPQNGVKVTIPNALKDATTDYTLWHKHFSGVGHDVPEAVVAHDAAKYSHTGTNLSFTTDRFSYFGVSYVAPDDGNYTDDGNDTDNGEGLAGTGMNLSRTLLLLLIALFGGSAFVRRRAYRVS